MPELIGKPLSALTANVLFDGEKIGTLQDITLEEDFNIKPVNQIGSSFMVEFLPGTSTGRLIAKRAMLESDLFFDRLTPGAKATDAISGTVKSISDGKIDIAPEAQVLEGLSDFWVGLFSGKIPRDRLNFVVYFDIEFLNEIDEVFAKFTKCVLKSRTLNMSIGNVIIMEDIIMMFQQREL